MPKLLTVPGKMLAAPDICKLQESWITPELAEQAKLRRVTTEEGAAIIGRSGGGDYSGILFPYFFPGQKFAREYRLRRDHPDLVHDYNGKQRQQARYLAPPGRGNFLYFVPGTTLEQLRDTSLLLVVCEGEKKALALWRLSHLNRESAQFLPIGLAGVYGWRGKIGKASGARGERLDIKGPISDLDKITWTKRKVQVLFDVDVRTNPIVAAARVALSKELVARGAEVFWTEVPDAHGVKGIDDLLAKERPEVVLDLITMQSEPFSATFRTTDLGNAERLISHYGIDLRYSHVQRQWFHWDGCRWVMDNSGKIVELAKQTSRGIHREAAEVEDSELRLRLHKWAMKSEDVARIKAMIKLAESERGIPAGPADFDADHWLLNCTNGTVDLRTGEMIQHTREHLITKLAPVEFDRLSLCPRWLRFLEEIFEPCRDIIPFIQRAVGYSLTGMTREECLFLLWGTGRNGKGTFLKTLASALGDYAGTADFSAFIKRRCDGPRDDVANMKGKRFVSAQEAEEGEALAESLIKSLTGGDRVRARRLWENSYEFEPTHKIWLATNHKPAIRGVDPAIWSRLKLIPFEISFEGREDRTLKHKLMDELAGILVWAVDGCLFWQREGLRFPASVVEATTDYRLENDDVGRFLDDSCHIGDQMHVGARTLYLAYRDWANKMGEEALTQTAFGTRMATRFTRQHRVVGAVYLGLGLKNESADEL